MSNPGAEESPRSPMKVKNTNQRSSSSSLSSGINNDKPFLPDEIIMDIVSRLPTKDALRFQSVCKRAKSLMSGPDFIESHRKRSCKVPMILALNNPTNPDPFFLDRFWGSNARNSKPLNCFRLYPDHIMQMSQDGLIVSKNRENPGIFIIFNPMYSDIVKITVPDSLIKQKCEIYGVFYQPAIKEYCTLWAFTVYVAWGRGLPDKVQYKLLNLGSEPKWRDITNPWTQNIRKQHVRPILVNEYLYWVVFPESCDKDIPMNVDIMEFDTRNEVFEVIPFPSAAIEAYPTSHKNLLQANGLLLLVQTNFRNPPIHLWTLESRSKKIWTHITINVTSNRLSWVDYTAVALWNEELLLQSGTTASELYVCDLKRGTERNFGKAFGNRSFAPHVMSLASLENCKSDICMVEEEGKENPVE